MFIVYAARTTDLKEADRIAEALRSEGFDAVIKGYQGSYVIQSGIFKQETNAKKLASSLSEYGLTPEVIGTRSK